jgi:hypothetical protein
MLCSEHEAAIERLSHARSMSRGGQELYYAQGYGALSYFLTGKYDEAASCAAQAALRLPTWLFPHLASAVAHGFLGKIDEARKSVDHLCKLNTGLRLSTFRQTLHFRRAEDVALFEEGLRLAGLPD